MRHTGCAADNSAARPAPNDQSMSVEKLRSCAKPRHSTRGRAHSSDSTSRWTLAANRSPCRADSGLSPPSHPTATTGIGTAPVYGATRHAWRTQKKGPREGAFIVQRSKTVFYKMLCFKTTPSVVGLAPVSVSALMYSKYTSVSGPRLLV